MRVLVCGGRDYGLKESERLFALSFLAKTHGDRRFSVIIEGGAKGADRLGRRFAQIQGLPCETYNADWKKWGLLAGPIRNGQMLRDGKPDLVIAFRGGVGTANMISLARRAGVEVIEVDE